MENEDQEYEQHQGEDDYILGNDDVQEEYIITEDDAMNGVEDDQDEVINDDMDTQGDRDYINDYLHFEHNNASIYAIAMHPINNNIIASGGGDDKAFLWDMSNATPQAIAESAIELHAHDDSVSCIAFSNPKNGHCSFVATGGLDGKIYISDSTNGQFLVMLEADSDVNWISWHPKGEVLLAGCADGSVWMWNISKNGGECMLVLQTPDNSPVTDGKFSADGKTIIASTEDGNLLVWSPKDSTLITKFTSKTFQDGHAFHTEGVPITSFAISRDNKYIATACDDGYSKLIYVGNGKICASFKGDSAIVAVEFCDTLPYVATGTVDGIIQIWDLNSKSVRHSLKHHIITQGEDQEQPEEDPEQPENMAITKLIFHGQYLFSSSADHWIRKWDAKTGRCVESYEGHNDVVLDMVLTNNGEKIVSGGDDAVCFVFPVNLEI